MKTSTSFKLRLIEQAAGNTQCRVMLRHDTRSYDVVGFKNHQHSVVLELPSRINQDAGFIAVDPDDILSVWVPRMPVKPND